MKRVSILILTFISLISFSVPAQSSKQHHIEFRSVYGTTPLLLKDTFYKLHQQDSIQFETFKFYVSGVEQWNKGELVFKETNSYHLIDFSDLKTLQMKLGVPSGIIFDQLKFNIGIDSITNVLGVMGGDLDPTKGMYWVWQSGYINFKLEGRSNLCNSRNHEFQFHLGGYLYPFNTLQTIILDVKQNEKIIILTDPSPLLSSLDLSLQTHIMSPGNSALKLSSTLHKIFTVQKK